MTTLTPMMTTKMIPKRTWPLIFQRKLLHSSSASAHLHPSARNSHGTKMIELARERIRKVDEDLRGASLIDKFGRHHNYLRISLTERCNLRCTYCMPADGVPLLPDSHLMSTHEILRLARIFVQQGVTKIRLTGGEPTVRKDLVDIVAGLNELRPLGLKTIGMTTNGIALKRKLPALAKHGLNQLNISIDTLKPDRFEIMTRRKGLDVVLESICIATEMPFESVKLNTVVINNSNCDELLDFVRLTKDMPVYIRFIEYMPFDGNQWNGDKFIPYTKMLQKINSDFPDVTKSIDEPNDTSKSYQIPGHRGKFGFITSMSDHFCGTCNRLRLLADGNIKVCLFGNSEVNLLRAMRNNTPEEEIVRLIAMAVRRKKQQHAEMSQLIQHTALNMPIQYRWQNIHSLTHRKVNRRNADLYGRRWTLRQSSFPPIVYPQATSSCRTNRMFSTTPSCQSQEKKHASQDCKDVVSEARLTHVDDTGRASMVDVGHKTETERTAVAAGRVLLGKHAFALVRDNTSTKGDVLTVAQIAGIQAAKQTSTLIPLCHPLLLNKIKVTFMLDEDANAVDITAIVRCSGRTGVEMEAIMAVSVAACTIYDMCKAVDKGIVITDIRLISKDGGKSGDFNREI